MATLEQQAIAEHLRAVAQWRRDKMQEFDPDSRNLRSAAGLEELAGYWLALPEDDERVVEMTNLTFLGQMFRPGQRTEWEIPRFRFYHEESTVEAFLNRLLELARQDADEIDPIGLPMVAGDNPWANRPTRIVIVEPDNDNRQTSDDLER
ncbi:MAG: hypothetical protein M3439_13585 [Chloroflexota bacterium]|nr:hypothetical protein [Chloroflexota bacterium]